jgi:ABC-type antimicrobial peptide transport system permease subunit
VPLTTDSLEGIQEIPGISEATPVLASSGEIRIDGKAGAVALYTAYNEYVEMEGIDIERGRVYEDGTLEAVVSPQTLDLLEVPQSNAIGRTLILTLPDPADQNKTIRYEGVTIVGLTDSTDTPTVYAPFSLLPSNGPISITSVKAVAGDEDTVLSATSILESRGYQVETLSETLKQARQVFSWVTLGLAIFGLIAIIVASIGMFNTLTIALLERTREFGIMKAIGVTDTTIRRLFLTEAGIIGFLGGVIGLLIALFTERILQAVLNQLVESSGGQPLELFQHPTGFLLLMVVFPLALGLFTGLYPAIRAARLNPLKALRYE